MKGKDERRYEHTFPPGVKDLLVITGAEDLRRRAGLAVTVRGDGRRLQLVVTTAAVALVRFERSKKWLK